MTIRKVNAQYQTNYHAGKTNVSIRKMISSSVLNILGTIRDQFQNIIAECTMPVILSAAKGPPEVLKYVLIAS